jgi:hypothetical protein
MRVSWNAQINPIVLTGGFIEVQYKSGADTEFSAYAMQAGNSTSCVIEPVAIGSSYVVRARTVNQLGVVGEFSYVSHAVGGTNSILTGNSNNLVPNSQFLESKDGWVYTEGDPSGNVVGFEMNMSNGYAGNDWLLQGSGGVFIVEQAWYRGSNGVTDAYWNVSSNSQATVKSGERLEVSAAIQVRDCSAALVVAFYDIAGLYCGETQVDTKSANDGWPLQNLAGWGRRLGGFLVVPQPAQSVAGRTPARAMVFARKNGKNGGGDQYSYMWATMFYLGRATSTQTDLSPWADGPVYDVSTGLIVDNAATRVYEVTGAASTTMISSGFAAGFGVVGCSVTFTAESSGTVSCTASVSGQLYANTSGQNLSATLEVAPSSLVGVFISETIAAGPAGQSWRGSASPTLSFQVTAGQTLTLQLRMTRDNWNGSSWDFAEFYYPRLRAELIKK